MVKPWSKMPTPKRDSQATYRRKETPEIRSYQTACDYIMEGISKQHRRLWGRNTDIQFDATHNPCISYRDITIITYLPDGSFVLNVGGHMLRVTRNKINYFIPEPYMVQRKHGVWDTWEVVNQTTLNKVDYADGIMVKPGQEPEFDNGLSKIALASMKEWAMWSEEYVLNYADMIHKGLFCDIPDNIIVPEQPDKLMLQKIISGTVYLPSMLRAAMNIDNPDPMYFRIMEECLLLPKSEWKTSSFMIDQAIGCYKRA